jgi:hypothetical protein
VRYDLVYPIAVKSTVLIVLLEATFRKSASACTDSSRTDWYFAHTLSRNYESDRLKYACLPVIRSDTIIAGFEMPQTSYSK